MTPVFMTLAAVLPLALIPTARLPSGYLWMAIGAAPALAAGLWLPVGSTVELDWLLLGVRLQLDELGRVFLLLSALVWMASGLYGALAGGGEPRAGRLRAFLLAAMAGNFLLILAADALTFYVGFAVMGLSTYGLVIARASQRARRAGRVYLVWTLVGELSLFAGIVLLAAQAGAVNFASLGGVALNDVTVALLLLAFGIKVGLPGLHLWMPLAYPAAPSLAAAVMSGPMINAGLLGILRFLPPGAPELAPWGEVLSVIGALGVLLGVAVGVTQRDPRAVLAYSSISKLGLMVSLYGALLSQGTATPLAVMALAWFAAHHLLAKSALFLGLGEWERRGPARWLTLGFVLLALSLASAPLTGGMATKEGLSAAIRAAGVDGGLLLGVATVGTVALMARFLWLTGSGLTGSGLTGSPLRARWPGVGAAPVLWLMLVATSFAFLLFPEPPASLFGGAATLLVGLSAVGLAVLLNRRLGVALPAIPPGDLYHLGARSLRRLRLGTGLRRWRPELPSLGSGLRQRFVPPPSLAAAGSLWLSLFVLLLLALSSPAFGLWR